MEAPLGGPLHSVNSGQVSGLPDYRMEPGPGPAEQLKWAPQGGAAPTASAPPTRRETLRIREFPSAYLFDKMQSRRKLLQHNACRPPAGAQIRMGRQIQPVQPQTQFRPAYPKWWCRTWTSSDRTRGTGEGAAGAGIPNFMAPLYLPRCNSISPKVMARIVPLFFAL